MRIDLITLFQVAILNEWLSLVYPKPSTKGIVNNNCLAAVILGITSIVV